MAQPLLALQHRNGASQQVYRITGATATTFGSALPSPGLEDDTGNATVIGNHNRVIQFQGDVYAAARNGVYKKDTPTSVTGAWTIDHTFTNPAAANRSMHIHGPYHIVLNDVPSIYVAWSTSTSTSTWNAAILNGNTDVWAEVGEQASLVADTTTAFGKSIVYRSVLYILYESGIVTFDPGTGTFGSIGYGTDLTVGPRCGFGIFNDRLLLIGRNVTSGNTSLFELTSGTVTTLFDTTLTTPFGGANLEARHTLVPSPNGTVLYAFVGGDTGGTGLSLLKIIDTAGTLSESADLTNPVIPVGLRPGSGTSGVRTWAFQDQATTPGTSALQVFHSADGGDATLVTQYLFVDEATVLTQEDQGASAAYAWTAVMTGGGERIFTPGELNIEIVERLAVLGGEAIRFKAYGDPGSVDKNVEFRFNTETEVPLTLATLTGTPSVVSGPAAAPGINVGLKRLTGVEADGVSIYETTWDISSDGVVTGQRAQLVPRVFV